MNQIINQEIIKSIQIYYNNTPLVIFLLGNNGSGKSSLRNYLNLSDIQTNIDPDALIKIYKYKYEANYQLKASKQALQMYNQALNLKLNICLESTLTGYGIQTRIKKAKQQGYMVVSYYLGLNSVELNLTRIATRVANGGHNIPAEIVLKRYQHSLNNLLLLKNYFDIVHVIDNSDKYFSLQFSLIDKKLNNQNRHLELWAKKLIKQII